MYPKSIQKLIDLFSKFPTVGPRTASRFVFYLIKLPQEKFEELSSSINNLRKSIKICSNCFCVFLYHFATYSTKRFTCGYACFYHFIHLHYGKRTTYKKLMIYFYQYMGFVDKTI